MIDNNISIASSPDIFNNLAIFVKDSGEWIGRGVKTLSENPIAVIAGGTVIVLGGMTYGLYSLTTELKNTKKELKKRAPQPEVHQSRMKKEANNSKKSEKSEKNKTANILYSVPSRVKNRASKEMNKSVEGIIGSIEAAVGFIIVGVFAFCKDEVVAWSKENIIKPITEQVSKLDRTHVVAAIALVAIAAIAYVIYQASYEDDEDSDVSMNNDINNDKNNTKSNAVMDELRKKKV